jgi:hypothetical protein
LSQNGEDDGGSVMSFRTARDDLEDYTVCPINEKAS